MSHRATTFVGLVGALALIAWLSPAPSHITDADTYERMSQVWIIRGCDDLQCFRALVPWMLGLLPGPSLFKWKGFAVLCEAGAALAMGSWVSRLGASPRAATNVVWLTAFGSGALYTLFDPYTSDALMHLLGPLLMLLVFDGRVAMAGGIAAVCVLAKEFAVVPLVVSSLIRLQERPKASIPVMAMSLVAFAAWAAWQVLARVEFGYGVGGNPSAHLLSGGFITYWATHIGPGLIVSTLAMTFGGLWLLWPTGVVVGSRPIRQLTIAGLPFLLLWCYLQQPDRALWNFAFLIMPAVALALRDASPVPAWSLVAAQTFLNLRVGAQLSFLPAARFALVAAIGLSIVIAWRALSAEGRLFPLRAAQPTRGART